MKHIFTSILLFFTIIFVDAQQANLFTIPNQSAGFIRMPSRATMIDVDAVFFNPANLPSLGNGVQISINNQILNQFSSIESEYQLYTSNPQKYEGNVKSFVFPSFFANWNINKTSFHGAFMIVGGAGGVDYKNLPISDRGIADIPSAITNSDFFVAPSLVQYDADNGTTYSQISDYRFNFQNKGLGFSPGVQFGVAHKLNDYFSFGFDLRWAQQVVTSEGEVSNIEILPNTDNPANNNWMSPGDYLRLVGAETGEVGYSNIAGVYDQLGGDRFINIRQKGSGFTFIPSVLIQPTEKLFIAIKYEHRTKLKLETLVRDGADGGTQYNPETGQSEPIYVDGEEVRSDLPGFISGGIGYQFTDDWRVNIGGRYMFFNGVDFNGREKYLKNSYYELEFATEYRFFDKLFASAGYTYNQANVLPEYHNDVDFWIPGHSIGFGAKYEFTPAFSLEAGAMITRNVGKDFTYNNHYYADGNSLAQAPPNYSNEYTMKFRKHSYIIGFGMNIKIKNDKNKTPNLIDEEDKGEDTPYNFRG